MKKNRPIDPHFQHFLDFKDQALIELYLDLRKYILTIYPTSNELLYHTHALTSVYSLSDRLSESFCMIPIYTNHLNLGFQKGTLLNDPKNVLKGTGKFIRHIPITSKDDYSNKYVNDLIYQSIEFVLHDMDINRHKENLTISKIIPS